MVIRDWRRNNTIILTTFLAASETLISSINILTYIQLWRNKHRNGTKHSYFDFKGINNVSTRLSHSDAHLG
ncbi:hypothetical protein P154DRAFT_120961 [Amniculicola lignicola CBS 123094]|uniref:Uncharacterized protein n=1 Tax=Amniculicola lignicola CBS 123094 TaxID=1392246 RepID=A0A6A5X3P4_9PLEO|nr:hypothetical protein P154DRAFT_120961 [Amniculicola lignicola CBS 123094]